MSKSIVQLKEELAQVSATYDEVAARTPSAPNWQLDELQDKVRDTRRALWDAETAQEYW